MSDAPFFDPWPEPESHEEGEQVDVDLPWLPPVHIVGVVVPVDLDVHRGPDAVVRVTHVVAHRRGLEVHVGTWVRPGTRRDLTSVEGVWHEQEPRIGIRLTDGTRLGHRPPHASPGEATSSSFTQTSGNGGGLHSSSSWWLHPVPEGDAIEVFVAWEHQGVPESSARVALAPLREAADREDVLWDPPPAPEEGRGWFAFAPMTGEVYRSEWSLSFEEGDPRSGQDES